MARSPHRKVAVKPRAKVWLEVDDNYVFGLGICQILEAVDETGSIKQAAAVVGKSYRHVWSRIKVVEQTLGIPLVATQVGGGDVRRSTLTGPARKLAAQYRDLREQLFALVEKQFTAGIQQTIDEAVRTAATVNTSTR